MVTTNGFPKAGNHALVKAVQLLGHPCTVEHLPVGSPVAEKHIFIKRDPRNIVCSWLRFSGKPVTPGMFITALSDFQGTELVAAMAEYEGWLADANTLVVSYEALITSPAEMRRIAAYLDTPYLEGAFEALPGMTKTWFATHSDFTAIWTPEVEAVWVDLDGPALLARWGY